MITMVALVNISITSHNCHFFFVIWTFQIYSQQLWSIQYNIVNYNTMLYIRSSALSYFVTGGLYSLTNISPPLSPWQPPFILLSASPSLAFLDSTYRRYHKVIVFLCLTCLTLHNAFKFHSCYCKLPDFPFSHG